MVNQVVLRLSPEETNRYSNPIANSATHRPSRQPADDSQTDPTLQRIRDLEDQISQLRTRRIQLGPHSSHRIGESGTYLPTLHTAGMEQESAPGIAESVEVLFPGVECNTLAQIIENRFKPTNIYRLLVSEKERAETQRTITIGGVDFEQAECDGKESEYRMSAFFKAWAAYSGILVKLAPYGLLGELATALFIYTMNLYDLLEKYTWDGVKAYHFQFHRKRVASGNRIYLPGDWQHLDSELVASKCFAHPIIRSPWPQVHTRSPALHQRITELPIRGNPFPTDPSMQSLSRSNTGYLTSDNYTNPVPGQGAGRGTMAITGNQTRLQVCRNWNHRDCRNPNCRYAHVCATCGRNHKASQCRQGESALSTSTTRGVFSKR